MRGSLSLFTPVVYEVCVALLDPLLLVLGECYALSEVSFPQPHALCGDYTHVLQLSNIPTKCKALMTVTWCLF